MQSVSSVKDKGDIPSLQVRLFLSRAKYKNMSEAIQTFIQTPHHIHKRGKRDIAHITKTNITIQIQTHNSQGKIICAPVAYGPLIFNWASVSLCIGCPAGD